MPLPLLTVSVRYTSPSNAESAASAVTTSTLYSAMGLDLGSVTASEPLESVTGVDGVGSAVGSAGVEDDAAADVIGDGAALKMHVGCEPSCRATSTQSSVQLQGGCREGKGASP